MKIKTVEKETKETCKHTFIIMQIMDFTFKHCIKCKYEEKF